MNDTVNDAAIVSAMLHFGGSFVQALAKAYQCADAQNQRIIRDAFPGYWTQYAEMAQLAAARDRSGFNSRG